MNLVLADCEEFKQLKRKDVEEKRTLGLIILRGTNIVCLSVEGPPPADPAARLGSGASASSAAIAPGPGIARPAIPGRGMAPSLAGPAAGVGGPGPGGFGGFQPPAGFPPNLPPGFVPPGGPGRGGPPGGAPRKSLSTFL
jgi:hypothetical protein